MMAGLGAWSTIPFSKYHHDGRTWSLVNHPLRHDDGRSGKLVGEPGNENSHRSVGENKQLLIALDIALPGKWGPALDSARRVRVRVRVRERERER